MVRSKYAGNDARAVFLAAAELCKQGFNVTLTSRNMAGADLLITDDRCRISWTIQVKVTDRTYKQRRGWLIGKKAKITAGPTHAYIFVMLDGDEPPVFYVVPSEFVATNQGGAHSMPEFSLTDAEAFRGGWKMLRLERAPGLSVKTEADT